MDEKRAVLRRRTYLAARLSSQDGIVWAEGVVRNLTEAGALIEAPNAPLPDALDIDVPMAGLRTRARVAWRGAEGRVGVRFTPTAPRSKPSAPETDTDTNY